MARCGDCNKFVSYEEQEPDVESLEYDAGSVTASVRIVNACDQCGTELREAALEMEAAAPEGWDDHDPDELRRAGKSEDEIARHEITAEEESSERTTRQDGKPGTPSRYRRMFYGARVEVKLSCRCGAWDETVTLEEDVQAGGMDEL